MEKDAEDSSSDEELVVTPGGPRPRHQVSSVKPGEAVTFERGEYRIMATSVTGVEQPNLNAATDIVLTPGGFRPKSLVHSVDSGQALDLSDQGRFRLLDLASQKLTEVPEVEVPAAAVPTLGSGWIAYAYWNNGTGTPISQFQTMWNVPPTPTANDGQTIFLFNGIQNYGNNYGILQPVLQWGTSAAGGGAYWSVASWYVTSGGQAFHTNLIQVNPGDTLVGVMKLTGQSGSLFSYTSEFAGIANTTLPINNIAELLWCNETLEAYSLGQCSDYPDTPLTAFIEINIQTGSSTPTISWTPVNKVVDCSQHAVVLSNSASYGEVDIFYSNQLADEECCSVYQNADGRLEVFALGTDYGLWHIWQTAPNSGWSGWSSLGGVLTTEPEVSRNADGRLEVFGRGTDNALWHIWQTAPNNGWSGWYSFGGIITSDPSIMQNADGRLEVFARGADDGLWHIWQTAPNNGWSSWSSLGGVITTEPIATANQDGRLEVFARGTDGALWHIWQTAPSNGWSGWSSLGGTITTDPAVLQNADGRLEVFVRGTDGALWHIWQTAPNNGWSSWASLGGVITSEPGLARNADGRLEVFARGTDDGLWHIWQTAPNNGWSGWASLAGVITSNPTGTNDADGRLEILARGTDNALWHIWQTAPNNGWSGWVSEGGVLRSL